MIKSKFKKFAVVVFISLTSPIGFECLAQNPIIQTRYTADPAPMVYNNTFYVYTGHDEITKTNKWFNMKEWRCYSSTDMSNWTDLGSPMNLKTFSWGNVDAWASQCVYRNGKFYWYACIRLKKNRFGIGVGVSDRPEGPFTDAIGKPLITGDNYLDPTVFIDDDGQTYMYFGNGKLWLVKLNQDMISTSGPIIEIPQTAASVDSYLEAPWLYKRNGLYYLTYAGQVPERENICYSTSSSPTGPWEYKGVIMPEEGASWTNHPGIIDYKENSYFVYHNGALPGGGNSCRSVCVDQFKYNADGTIPLIRMTTTGSEQIGNLNPYIRHQAEEICWEEGIKTETSSKIGVFVTSIDNGDYIKVKGVDFGKGAKAFKASVASASKGGKIEIHIDSALGLLLGTCNIENTNDWNKWITKRCKLIKTKGVHDVYFVFKGEEGKLFNFDYWKFK
ncbi:glycoside hydrolase family 43 protein [Flavobacterium undicola]|uniref:glycoside hydrolase family 43 protein n=1 Tax=Flavobacterium undicola TaxID=1932779 RepID=UPI001378F1BE|nr:glycoside hydrolase family 43 protein [Flavobacterium undicola]MBA0882697.1 family 43 glycosylhydrolase [Flavobacterium undicola]